jgi:hypothetical protein
MSSTKLTQKNEIHSIFEANELSDLKRFIVKRQHLNTANTFLRYFFHFVQYSSILITTIAVSNDSNCHSSNGLVWVGIGLNVFSTLINAFENVNHSISKKLLHDIKLIKTGNYIDESDLIESMRVKPTTKSPE